MLQRLGPGAGAIIAFLAIALVGSLLSPTFLTQRNVTNVMRQTAMLGVVTVGMTFVILTAGIDLSVGMVLSFTSVAAAMLFDNGQGLPLPIVFLATLALGSAIGAFNGFMIIWRGAAPFVVTLAMMAIAGGAALTVSGGKPIGGIQGTYAWLGSGSVGPIPVLVLIMLAVFLLGALVLRYTPYGRHAYAIGGNEEASRLSGIAVDRVKVMTYTISGLLSALGGIIFSARVTVGDPWAGRGLELDAIAAVVIGGTRPVRRRGDDVGQFAGRIDHHDDQQCPQLAQRFPVHARSRQRHHHPRRHHSLQKQGGVEPRTHARRGTSAWALGRRKHSSE